MKQQLRVKLLSDDAKLPTRAYNSAAYDLYSAVDQTLNPGATLKIPLDIATEFPDSMVALIWDRSSMGAKGLHTFAGVIDSDYRGPWAVILHNATPHAYTVNKGDKVAQAVIQLKTDLEIFETDELGETERGQGGFGTTGV